MRPPHPLIGFTELTTQIIESTFNAGYFRIDSARPQKADIFRVQHKVRQERRALTVGAIVAKAFEGRCVYDKHGCRGSA